MNVLSVDPERCGADDLRAAAAWLRAGRVVAFPTDTFYGFAVDPASSDAVRVLFALKGRPADSALPLVAASMTQVAQLGGVWSPAMTALARAFWPGPLSLVCDAPAHFVTGVPAGRSSVAIRVLDHRVARRALGDAAAKKREASRDHQLMKAIELLKRSGTQVDLFAAARPVAGR